jgi:hypothetical protein
MESVHSIGVLVIYYVPVLLSKCQILNCIVCARNNLRGQKSLGPLKMSLGMAHKVIVPPKKIISRSFLNSGTLIVNWDGVSGKGNIIIPRWWPNKKRKGHLSLLSETNIYTFPPCFSLVTTFKGFAISMVQRQKYKKSQREQKK